MQRKLADRITDLLIRGGRPNRPVVLAVFLAFMSPILIMAAMSYVRDRRDLTSLALSRRESVAFLASATVKADLDRLKDIGVSLATRVRFRELVKDRRWDEAILILKQVPETFPFIERVFLADADGTLRADNPALPNVRGADFSYRDWYRGVTRTQEPYVSDVYRRAAEPRMSVFAVAVPIKADGGGIIAILVMQVRLDVLLGWIQHIELGPEGILYIVDAMGHLAAHPRRSLQEEIVDYSNERPVQKVLRGGRGIEVWFEPQERRDYVYTFQPVAVYGWGVVAQQPASIAFAARDAALRNVLIAYALIVLFSATLTWLILRALVLRKAAEEQITHLNADLKRRATELAATNRELEAFSYSVSHDLRAPLRSIDGFSQALEKDCAARLDERGKGHLQRIRAAAQRMGRLIDDLLGLSRLTLAPLRLRAVDLSGIAAGIADDLRKAEPGRRAEFRIAPALTAHGDEGLLRVVLDNLLRNAWKFTRKLPVAHIEFGSVREDGIPAFYVRDDGAGFDMEYTRNLFGAFQRLHPASEFEGNGIGLAIVARVVRRHGGRVWAEGAVGKGATFYFTCAPSNGEGTHGEDIHPAR